jgi:HEPN domain-containing protein
VRGFIGGCVIPAVCTKGEAIRWFLQGEDDQQFVEWVWKENKFFDKGCFIAQQAGEKFLKACLYARGERQ